LIERDLIKYKRNNQ